MRSNYLPVIHVARAKKCTISKGSAGNSVCVWLCTQLLVRARCSDMEMIFGTVNPGPECAINYLDDFMHRTTVQREAPSMHTASEELDHRGMRTWLTPRHVMPNLLTVIWPILITLRTISVPTRTLLVSHFQDHSALTNFPEEAILFRDVLLHTMTPRGSSR